MYSYVWKAPFLKVVDGGECSMTAAQENVACADRFVCICVTAVWCPLPYCLHNAVKNHPTDFTMDHRPKS